MKKIIKRTFGFVLSLIILTVSLAVLSACDGGAKKKRIIGLNSDKTYIKNYYCWQSSSYYRMPMQLPIISLDPIKPEEIEKVELKHREIKRLVAVDYNLLEQTSNDGNYCYLLYVYLSGEPVLNEHITGISVTIGGKVYDFTADITLKWVYNDGVRDYFIQPTNLLQMVGYNANENKAQIQFMVSIEREIEITDIAFHTAGIDVTGLEIYKNESWEKVALPYVTNASDLRMRVTYTEPDDCLYYGNYVVFKYNADNKNMSCDSSQGVGIISCSGSALRG